jgi:hypothetical protein
MTQESSRGSSILLRTKMLLLIIVGLLGTSAVEGQIVSFPSAAPSTASQQPSSIEEELSTTSDAPSSVPSLQTCVKIGGRCETDFDCCGQEETFCSVMCKPRVREDTKDDTKLYQEDNTRGSLTRRTLKGSNIRKGF